MTDQQTQTDAIVFTKKELWLNQAPCLNFQYDEDQLLKLALRRKFVTQIGEDQYLVNQNY